MQKPRKLDAASEAIKLLTEEIDSSTLERMPQWFRTIREAYHTKGRD